MNELSHKSDLFYLTADSGKLLTVYTAPEIPRNPAENVLIVPAFSEEMNRARRLASLQAKRLSALGVGTLVVDLHGTGDSDGLFIDARWDTWKSDIAAAVGWLRTNHGGKISLLGIRLGAMLAMDYARQDNAIDKIVLWQPVISGARHIRDFLFVRVLEGVMQKSLSKLNIKQLRHLLNNGESVEVSGYELSPELFKDIDSLHIESLMPGDVIDVHWIEVSLTEELELKPDSQKLLGRWKEEGINTQQYKVNGHTFWVDGKVKVTPDLLEVTAGIFEVP